MVSYPISLPAQGVARLRIYKARVDGMNASPYTGKQEVVGYPGQWWEADVSFAPADIDQAGAIEAFIGLLDGRGGTFLMGDPMRATPRGLAASSPGTPVVDGAQLKGSSTLAIKNGGLSKVKYLKAGDLIQLGSAASTRLHQVLVDADTDGAGKTTLTLWPALRDDVANGDTVVVSNCKGLFRMKQSRQAIDRSPGPKTDFSFEAMEAL